MSHSIFEGSAAAVVTPMNGYGNLDFDAFGRLLEWMIREGTDAVVVNGTTGESATLDDKEKMAVIRYAVRQVDGRIPVIAGTGSNCTEHAVKLSREAEKLGAAPNPVGAESKYEMIPMFYRVSGTFRKADPTLEHRMIRINPMRAGADTILRIIKESVERVK